jgi:hypothetical protein
METEKKGKKGRIGGEDEGEKEEYNMENGGKNRNLNKG